MQNEKWRAFAERIEGGNRCYIFRFHDEVEFNSCALEILVANCIYGHLLGLSLNHCLSSMLGLDNLMTLCLWVAGFLSAFSKLLVSESA